MIELGGNLYRNAGDIEIFPDTGPVRDMTFGEVRACVPRIRAEIVQLDQQYARYEADLRAKLDAIPAAYSSRASRNMLAAYVKRYLDQVVEGRRELRAACPDLPEAYPPPRVTRRRKRA